MTDLWNLDRLAPREGPVLAGETLVELFWNAVAARGDRTWLREKRLGLWQARSWRDVGTRVRRIAMGLAALGFAPGDTASILSNTVVDWVETDLGILSAGGVSNGIYPTDAAPQVEFLCADSSTRILFVEDDEQLDKALEVRSRLPRLDWIVVFDMDGLRRFEDPRVMSLATLCDRGDAHDRANPGLFEARCAARGPDDLAILIYTSGTTGKPKGVMHSHRSLVYGVRGYDTAIRQDEDDERMCFLPLCHVAERVVGVYAAMHTGAKLNFVENPDTVPENIREIAPTVVGAVPRVWEKFYSAVTIAVAEAGWIQQRAYRWAIGTGGAVADRVLAGQPVPTSLRVRFRIARWLVLDNVRKLIGIHRARVAVTGAAPISPDLIRWYLSLGLPMLEVWGQTETGGVSTWMPYDRIRPGSIGVATSYNEVRVDPQTGELLVRGPNVFMGYLNQPERTRETIDADGWLHTGDVGRVDADGYFSISDRMKDIIITAGGKNITPSEFENELKFSPYVTDAVLLGDRRAYLTALVMIDHENVEKFAQDNDVPFTTYASLTRAPQVRELIQREIDKVNAKFARVEQVKSFRLIENRLTAEDEELTPTMKLKRRLVQQKYADLIESMYQS